MSRLRQGKYSEPPSLKRLLVMVILFVLLLSACSPGEPVLSVPSEPEPLPTETAAETEIPASIPTPSPTSERLPSIVYLLAPPESDPLQVEEVQPVLEELTSRVGYRLEITNSLSTEQITSQVRLVVVLPPDPGLEALAASAGETMFFAIGIPGLEELPNLISTFPEPGGVELQGFMGGVIAAMVTPDWRIGSISVSDTSEGLKAREGFINGALYFCGTCRQIYPPFFDSQNQLIQYPLSVELPSTASGSEWQAAAEYLIERGVESIYVYPDAGGEELLSYLADAGKNILSGIDPPDGIQEYWIASIYSNHSSSWQAILEMTLLGQQVPQHPGVLKIENVNPDLFSPGRQKLAQSIMEDLLAGYIEAVTVEEPISDQ
jgi:hypothetical protein